MARSTHHEPHPTREVDAPHVVGVYSTDAASEPETVRARRADRVGGDAVRRATVLGACGAAVGAVLFGVALAVFTSSTATVVVAGVIGGAVLIGAIGALYGAFSRMGSNDDWREAMPDTPRAPDIDLTERVRGDRGASAAEERRSVSQLVERGALAVTDANTAAAGSASVDHTGGRSGPMVPEPASFAAPSSSGHVLSSEDFLGRVPVTMVFCPEGPAIDGLLRSLDDVFPRFGEARVQLLVVLSEDAEAVQRRHDVLGIHLPLLADPDGRIALDHGVVGIGQQVRTLVMDRDGVLVDDIRTDVTTTEAGALLDRTTAAAAMAPERFAPRAAHRG